VINELKIAIAGLGTIGSGTVTLLNQQNDLLINRTGRHLRLVSCSALKMPTNLPLDNIPFFSDAREMIKTVDFDILIELIGGADDVALDIVTTTLKQARHVVTANKAMIAHHGHTLAILAEQTGVTFGFEAAVAGGIPIIKVLREGLAANSLSQIYGILNGTCNYILTTMRKSGREFNDVLAESQSLGYAEADPSLDIDGLDTAHKLSILTSLTFGTIIDFSKVHIEGIRNISTFDINSAEELGYSIKLLGIARHTENGIEQRVHPCMVPIHSSIGHVDDVFNAIVAEGPFIGRTLFEGRGAGAIPTASAVIADILDIASGRYTPTFGIPAKKLIPLQIASMKDHRSSFYIRLTVLNRSGVFAKIAAAFRDEKISMEAILQRRHVSDKEIIPVVITVHDTLEYLVLRVINRIQTIQEIVKSPYMIRMETLL
jgi:homoserine dehydrogenase